MNTVTIIPEQSFLQQQSTLMEARAAKEPPETQQRNILGTPRRTNPLTGQVNTSIGGGIERMVGVTSVNLGGIEVDVEDVANRLRRLKVRTQNLRKRANILTIRNGNRHHPVLRRHLVLIISLLIRCRRLIRLLLLHHLL